MALGGIGRHLKFFHHIGLGVIRSGHRVGGLITTGPENIVVVVIGLGQKGFGGALGCGFGGGFHDHAVGEGFDQRHGEL